MTAFLKIIRCLVIALRRDLIVCGLCICGIYPACATDLGKPSFGSNPNEESFFVLVNAEITLAHEMAHVVIDELDVPVFGNSEVAADYIGVLLFSSMFSPDEPFSTDRLGLLMAIADEVRLEWTAKNDSDKKDYWSLHPLEPQRFYNLSCLLYGSDPDNHEHIREYADIPFSRSFYCREEYETAYKSARWLVENFGRGGQFSQQVVSNQLGISIEYEVPDSQGGKEIELWLKQSHIIEAVVKRAESLFLFPKDFKITVANCQQPEAMWLRGKSEIVLCYQLLERYQYLENYRYYDVPQDMLKMQDWNAYCMYESVAEHYRDSYCKVDAASKMIKPANPRQRVIFEQEQLEGRIDR